MNPSRTHKSTSFGNSISLDRGNCLYVESGRPNLVLQGIEIVTLRNMIVFRYPRATFWDFRILRQEEGPDSIVRQSV